AHAGLHCCSDFVGGVVPDIDQFGTTFVIRDQTGFVLGLNFDCLIFIAFHDGGFVEVRGDVRDRYGHTRPGAPVEASVFEVVQRTSGIYQWVAFSKIVDQFAKGALGGHNFYPWVEAVATKGTLAELVNDDRKSTRLNSSHVANSSAVPCL